MVDLATSFAAGFLATFVPLYAGLFLPKFLGGRQMRDRRTGSYLAAASAGVMFWFFLDVMGDAAQLDVNQGFSTEYPADPVGHAVLALLFPLALGSLILLERRYSKPKASETTGTTSLPAPSVVVTFVMSVLAALAIGFHAVGEGVIIGSALPSSPDIISAIGSLGAGIAYVLHKLLEGFVIGSFAVLASAATTKRIGILGLISGIPTLIGVGLGLPSIYEASWFFALGGAGALYILIKLVPVFTRSRPEYASMIPLLLGFFAMYVAGLFHSG